MFSNFAPSVSVSSDTQKPHTGARRFYKTELCPDFLLGMCPKGRACKLAHGAEDLQLSPDLKNTKICPQWAKNGTCSTLGCRFAHGRHELRPLHPSAFTSLCAFFVAEGKCKRGLNCHYAHGDAELRPVPLDMQLARARKVTKQNGDVTNGLPMGDQGGFDVTKGVPSVLTASGAVESQGMSVVYNSRTQTHTQNHS
eukprot:GDKI01040192.1.p1 GENE.GDKI01040192.1~~GDKI01040192.1.p1  ORF type:complete len:197 (+),score=40.79 GDKI01040192.1:88-678(+)